MPVDLYVYYRPTRPSAALARRLQALQQTLVPAHAARARLRVRCDDAATWMEIYENVNDRDALQQALMAALDTAGIAAELQPRHEEWFTDHPATLNRAD